MANSQTFRNGNRGDIKINGVNFSTNIRGVNIVVYDTDEATVIDSVGFDSHFENEIQFIRKE